MKKEISNDYDLNSLLKSKDSQDLQQLQFQQPIYKSQVNYNIQNYQNLFKLRILQKNLIYVIGLSPSIADETILQKKEYFRQYGNIVKLMVNKNNAFNQNGVQGHSYSAYVTYSSELEAITAIQCIDNFEIHERVIKASYGTTKYCQYFLKNIQCNNKQCLYIHELQDNSLIYNETINNKEIFKLQQ